MEQAPGDPLILEWDADTQSGYRLPYYSAGTVLMRESLVQALTRAGVSNLETFPVVIRSPNGAPECRDYLAVNILGVVDAIDRDESEILGDDPDLMMIESLAIDREKAGERRMFRLKDAANIVVITKAVFDALGDEQTGLDCIEPSEYAG